MAFIPLRSPGRWSEPTLWTLRPRGTAPKRRVRIMHSGQTSAAERWCGQSVRPARIEKWILGPRGRVAEMTKIGAEATIVGRTVLGRLDGCKKMGVLRRHDALRR